MRTSLGALAALASLCTAEAATAQYRTIVPGGGNFARMRQHYSTRATIRATGRLPSTRMAGPSRLGNSTSFRAQAPEITPALLASQIARSPSERTGNQRAFSQHLKLYRERLLASGGPQTDVARAAAFLVAKCYELLHGNMTDRQFAALREQLQASFAADRTFQSKSDRDRQIEFELYAILGIIAIPPNPSQKPLLIDFARGNLAAIYGVPSERLVITDQGMRILAPGKGG